MEMAFTRLIQAASFALAWVALLLVVVRVSPLSTVEIVAASAIILLLAIQIIIDIVQRRARIKERAREFVSNVTSPRTVCVSCGLPYERESDKPDTSPPKRDPRHE